MAVDDICSLTCLIAAHGRPLSLRRTLDSICQSSLPSSSRLIVVENGRQSGLEDIVDGVSDQLPIEYMYHPAANKSEALNAGLAACDEGLIVMLDDDVEVDPGIWDAYRRAAACYPDGVYFGGPVRVQYAQQPDSWLLPFLTASVKGWSLGETDCWAGRHTHFLGANWAAMKRDLIAIGGFDASMGPGTGQRATGQESEAQARLRRRSIRPRYVADAILWHCVHREQVTAAWTLSRRERSGRELAMMIRRHCPSLLYRPILEIALLAQRVRVFARHGLSDQQKEFAAKWHDAYRKGAFDTSVSSRF